MMKIVAWPMNTLYKKQNYYLILFASDIHTI
jgi:hypothetical protein